MKNAVFALGLLLLCGCQNSMDKHFEELNDHFGELNSRIDDLETSLKQITEENEELKMAVDNNCGQ